MVRLVQADRLNVDAKAPTGTGTKFITVFTDASYCSRTKSHGCCFWVREGDFKPVIISWGGKGLANSFQAEQEALTHAVNAIINNCILDESVVVVIQSDCVGALEKLSIKSLQKRVRYVKLKHVKAHTNRQTARTRVNAICDELAGVEMNKQRRLK